jgi:hypothetical protein
MFYTWMVINFEKKIHLMDINKFWNTYHEGSQVECMFWLVRVPFQISTNLDFKM